jgi:Protein of unknown function (DUF4035)
MAFYRLEPFGEERQDLRAAIIAQTIANVNRGTGRPPYRLKDFILEFDGEERANKAPQPIEDQIQVMQRLTRALSRPK